MTQKFINAWCEEHNFSDKVGAVIYFEDLKEKDLDERNFSEDEKSIQGIEGTYTVYDQYDIQDMIKDEKEEIKRDIMLQINHIQNPEVYEFINWDDYFEDYPIEIEDVLDDFTICDFNYNRYYITPDD